MDERRDPGDSSSGEADPPTQGESEASEGRHYLPVTATDGRPRVSSHARIVDDWYVACESGELGEDPHPFMLFGQPIVLFRDAKGQPHALLDRCPHRNIPLSQGRVIEGELECRYHGWRFDGRGACTHVPALRGDPDAKSRCATHFSAREAHGVVWVYATPDAEPARDPWEFRYVGRPGYRTIVQSFESEGTVHAVAENALDVPHTAFVHAGLFRTVGQGPELEVVVRRWHDRCEAEYVGEPAPRGVVGRILAPRGGVVRHYDRFWLPSIAEVDYRLGEASHVNVVSAITPITPTRSRLTSVTCVKLPMLTGLVAAVVKPIAKRIFMQDAEILAAQVDTIDRFGGERFASTELDALGPHILRLLRNAERGDRTPRDEPVERRFTMKL